MLSPVLLAFTMVVGHRILGLTLFLPCVLLWLVYLLPWHDVAFIDQAYLRVCADLVPTVPTLESLCAGSFSIWLLIITFLWWCSCASRYNMTSCPYSSAYVWLFYCSILCNTAFSGWSSSFSLFPLDSLISVNIASRTSNSLSSPFTLSTHSATFNIWPGFLCSRPVLIPQINSDTRVISWIFWIF